MTYAYDVLNRLSSAAATSGSWGQSYGYDGFGNLTSQSVTAGTAPSYSASFDGSNHTGTFDANGNSTVAVDGAGHAFVYDVENRAVTTTALTPGFRYSYAPGNKRVWRGLYNTSGAITTDEVTFWGVTGQKLGVYQLTYVNTTTPPTVANWVWYSTQTSTNYYFGSKLIKNAAGYIGADRLGSIGKFYPWGQEKPSATTNGTEKFTGYMRDVETGLDYAVNRYHASGTGRFMTSDPYMASGGPADPGSWNRYAYTRGDPINRVDAFGREDCSAYKDASMCQADDPDLLGGGGPDTCVSDDFASASVCNISDTSAAAAMAEAAIGDCPTYTSATGTFYTCFHQSGGDWKKLTKNLNNIDKRLHKDKECEDFLTSNGVTMDTIDADLNNAKSTFTLAGTIVRLSGGILAGTTNNVPGQTPIIINSYLYQNSTRGQDYLTVLHELSHLLGVIPSDGNPALSAKNDQKVLDNCSKTIGSLQ